MKETFKREYYKAIFDNSPAAKLIIATDAPLYTMLDVNNAYLKATNSTREALIGKSVFAVFPKNPSDNDSQNIERTKYSFEQAILTKKAHVMRNYRYDIPIPNTTEFEERYWTTSNTPVLDENGNIEYFIHSPENVTELFKLAEKEKLNTEALLNQREQLLSTFMQAPVGIGIFKGDQYIVDLINPPLCKLYGLPVQELINKPIFDAIPQIKGQGFEELIDGVRLTGKSYKGNNVAVQLNRNGKIETVFVNFVYEPFREINGTITGVIAIAIDVTDEVIANRKLAYAEESARLAVEAVDLGTFDLNLLDGEMTTSLRFANLFGFDEIVKRADYVNVIHPDDREQRIKAHEASLITGKLKYDARAIWKDKSVHWLKVEGKVMYDSIQRPIRILGTLLDVTTQREAKQKEEKLITLVDNSVDLMSILDFDGTNSYINQAGLDMLGFDNVEQVASTPIKELHDPKDFELVEKEVLPTVMTKGRWVGEMLVRHLKTHEIFPVLNNCIRIDDPITGKPLSVGAVMRDLRPELLAKQALADSELLLRNITTAAPTGLWKSDEFGSINYVNQTWIEWTGISFENNMGDGWLKAIITDDKEKALLRFLHDIELRITYEVEYRINHSDGNVHWCIATGKPQYNADGSFVGYIGSCVDISEQKYLQQQKDNFIAIASHELKTPVTSIKAYTQLLEKMLYAKGETKEAGMIAKMDKQLNRLISLIGDLLDATKINTGKLQFNDIEFDFSEMLNEIVDDLQRTSSTHSFTKNLLAKGLVYGDKERIGQVISNLVTNAIKYSPGSKEIIINSIVKTSEVQVCVQDFGIGIPKQSLEKVFEQFYRVSGDMQHTFPGLGLGLYISSEIIKREGGRIWVTSEEGKGSTFCFSLPVAKK